MIIEREKFPFKWMLNIIEALESEESLSSLQIARVIRVCVPDAKEVTQMLQYMTSFGKIILDLDGKWKITLKKEASTPPLPTEFRFKYIKTLAEIIKILHKRSQSVSELAQKTSHEIDDIQEALEFLALITGKGKVQLTKNDTPQQWSLKSW
ncbi:MAG: hypothetical protein JSU57_05925 [Candidatus Heimdallarchaeota archaeon]|nr:MAG: hypothetical protein JSU57_05925 [Candidatus Heimdallarchaeota archaeon]